MRRRSIIGQWIGVWLWVGILVAGRAEALVVINEILADPPAGVGDANQDGVVSSTQDEFVEVLNNGVGLVDLSGWRLSDAVKDRHVFPAGTVLNGKSAVVVFGGGAPSLTGVFWQTASKGSLGLNNGGDTVFLYDAGGNLVDSVHYGPEGGDDQSLTRVPDGSGLFFEKHTAVNPFLRYSPGYQADGLAFSSSLTVTASTVTPEPPVWLAMLMGLSFLFRKKFLPKISA